MTDDYHSNLRSARSQVQDLYQDYDQQEVRYLDGWMSERVDEIGEALTDAEGETSDAVSERDERIAELEARVEELEQQITMWEDGE